MLSIRFGLSYYFSIIIHFSFLFSCSEIRYPNDADDEEHDDDDGDDDGDDAPTLSDVANQERQNSEVEKSKFNQTNTLEGSGEKWNANSLMLKIRLQYVAFQFKLASFFLFN